MSPTWRELAVIGALVVGGAVVALLALLGLFVLVVEILL